MNRRNRLRRAALVLALFVVATIVTGVAASATNTVNKQLTGKWERGDGVVMVVGPRGKVNFSKAMINEAGWYHAKFSSRVTSHRLRISGPRSCSGTGTYNWTMTPGFGGTKLAFTRIQDACKLRVGLMIETADGYSRPGPP